MIWVQLSREMGIKHCLPENHSRYSSLWAILFKTRISTVSSKWNDCKKVPIWPTRWKAVPSFQNRNCMSRRRANSKIWLERSSRFFGLKYIMTSYAINYLFSRWQRNKCDIYFYVRNVLAGRSWSSTLIFIQLWQKLHKWDPWKRPSGHRLLCMNMCAAHIGTVL